jgi:hypothetical protein
MHMVPVFIRSAGILINREQGTQRGNGRRPERRPLQNACGSRGGGCYIKRGAAQKAAVAVTERGRSLQAAVTVTGSGRPLQAAVTGSGRPVQADVIGHNERAAVTGDHYRNNALRQDASKVSEVKRPLRNRFRSEMVINLLPLHQWG